MALEMKYFVLKPSGNKVHSKASRHAMKAYADALDKHSKDPEDAVLANQLREWAAAEATDAQF